MNIHDSNLTLPRPEGEPIMHTILVVGMVIMILVAILSAYMDAMLYLRSHQTITTQTTNNQSGAHASNHHNSKDRSSGGGHGAAATISTSISNQQHQSSPLSLNNSPTTPSTLPFISIANGNVGKNNINVINNKSNNNNNGNSKNTCAQKRRKNSSTANSEKVPTNTNKSIKSSSTSSSTATTTTTTASTTSPYAPIFQNLTNVIASPPPPLPTFDSEFNSLEFKKIKGSRESAKKSNSLSGSLVSSSSSSSSDERRVKDPIAGDQRSAKSRRDMDDRDVRRKSLNPRIPNGVCDKVNGNEEPLDVDFREELLDSDKKKLKTDDGDRKVLKHKESKDSRDDNTYNHHDDNNHHHNHDSTPSSLTSSTASTSSSASSSSSTSSTPPLSASSSSSTSSSTSSSPPLSASSYGEYSLLGPGASFELPCLRVRSNNTMIM